MPRTFPSFDVVQPPHGSRLQVLGTSRWRGGGEWRWGPCIDASLPSVARLVAISRKWSNPRTSLARFPLLDSVGTMGESFTGASPRTRLTPLWTSVDQHEGSCLDGLWFLGERRRMTGSSRLHSSISCEAAIPIGRGLFLHPKTRPREVGICEYCGSETRSPPCSLTLRRLAFRGRSGPWAVLPIASCSYDVVVGGSGITGIEADWGRGIWGLGVSE